VRFREMRYALNNKKTVSACQSEKQDMGFREGPRIESEQSKEG